MSRAASGLIALHLVIVAMSIGVLLGHKLGLNVGEARTIACTQWCQRAAGMEYGARDWVNDCACYGDVRELAAELDHAKIDTGWWSHE
jgi:hypothetical protein